MGDYYQHFLTSMSGGQPPMHQVDANGVPVSGAPPVGVPVTPIPMAPASITLPYSPAPYFQGTGPAPDVFPGNASAQRWRRRFGGMEHVKHRRTRSGCLMCRQRRVKCDEARPICDRCKKGDRECIYPPPKTKEGKAKKKGKTPKDATPKDFAAAKDTIPGSSISAAAAAAAAFNPIPEIPVVVSIEAAEPDVSDGEDDDGSADETDDLNGFLPRPLETIRDQDESSPANTHMSSRMSALVVVSPHDHVLGRNTALTSMSANSPDSLADGGGGGGGGGGGDGGGKFSASVSPVASTGASSSAGTDVPPNSQSSLLDYSYLSSDHQQSLNWFHQNMTHYHYGVISDPDQFFSITLPNLALYEEALLFGIVAFSKYLQTLEDPDGDINDFVVPFNSSVTMLLSKFQQHPKPTIVMLAAILQLATIEEYLGDWVSLSGHQVAAKTLLVQLYTIDNIMETSIGRVILAWYSRFDCFIGIIGRLPTALDHEWFAHYVEDMGHRASVDPQNVRVLQEEGAAQLRVCSEQIARINYMISNNLLAPQDYFVQHGRISALMGTYFNDMNSKLLDPAHIIDFAALRVELDPYGVVNLLDPSFRLYEEPLFGVNILVAEFHSIIMMHNFQQAMADRNGPLFKDCQQHAYAICAIFEGIEKYPDSPKGALILVQSCLGLAAMFFPSDANHRNWLRQKFALVEKMGYIQSTTSRNNMTLFFNDPTTAHWWYPNEEGFTPVLHAVRSYNEERTLRAKAWQEELRDVSHIFSSLKIEN